MHRMVASSWTVCRCPYRVACCAPWLPHCTAVVRPQCAYLQGAANVKHLLSGFLWVKQAQAGSPELCLCRVLLCMLARARGHSMLQMSVQPGGCTTRLPRPQAPICLDPYAAAATSQASVPHISTAAAAVITCRAHAFTA